MWLLQFTRCCEIGRPQVAHVILSETKTYRNCHFLQLLRGRPSIFGQFSMTAARQSHRDSGAWT